jgi:phytoene synthase
MKTMDAYAINVLRSHGRSFYFASYLLSNVFRHRAARLYAFCRYVDDVADENPDPQTALRQIDSIRQALYAGVAQHSAVQNMLNLRLEITLPMAPVDSLLDGVQSDLDMTQLKNEAELIQYAYKVAGTVGLMMCPILNVGNSKAWPFAVDLGIAMQLTNIARDVGEDASKGRVYLPFEWTGGLTPDDILAPNAAQQERLRAGVTRILALAQTYYDSGIRGLGYLPLGARYGILLAALVYREIGVVLAEKDYRSWETRAMVSMPRKIFCAARELPRYWLRSKTGVEHLQHHSSLHQHLQGYLGASDAAPP